MNLSSGTRLGRYEIRALLGSGGMGEVYLAYDRDLEREIAIKVLRDGSGDSGDRLRRFEQEAKAASALHHPNIAHVYEIGSQDNLRFIAMELVQGETLRDRLARGPMPIADVLDMDDRTPRHPVALELHFAARECVRGQIIENQIESDARGEPICRGAAQEYRRKTGVRQLP